MNETKGLMEVLIVEDSLTQAEKLKYLLVENNYSVSTASNGHDALSLLRHRKPSIIISDIIMPGMDGYELCGKIKADEKLKDIPVILLTALSEPADVLRGLECNADNFITKPYDDNFLLLKINSILTKNEAKTSGEAQPGVEVVHSGQKYLITLQRRQIIDLLLSTYEIALQQKEERTAALHKTKLAEEALRQSEERFRLAIMHSPVCVSNQDLNLRYIWQFNPQLAYSVNDVLGKTDLDVLPVETARRLMELKQKVITTGNQVKDEITMEKNGSMRSYYFAAEPMRNREGAIIGVANAIIDITEEVENRRKIEDLNHFLERRADELAFANKELEAFSYSVAHDLRNPLHAIAVCAGLLKKPVENLDKDSQEALSHISQAAGRMAEVIADLLNLSKISRQEVNLKKIDLTEMAWTVFKDLAALEPGRSVKFIAEPGLSADVDSGLAKLLFENLLGNAWKYTMTKEHVLIEFGATVDHGTQTFFIRDNGVGFDMAHADRLFKPFQRLHSPKQFRGTGIGLAIVQRVVQRHGGQVWGESKDGNGATFYFTIGKM